MKKPPHPARTLRSGPSSPARREGKDNPSLLAGEGGARRASGGRVRGSSKESDSGTPSSVKAAEASLPPSPTRGEGPERCNEGEAPILIGRAKTMRCEPTDAEKKLWYLLRDRRLSGHKFRRQVPLGSYIADFVSYEARLIIEADGGQHNESVYDTHRDQWFSNEGFKVLRFWNTDVLKNPEGVLLIIQDAVAEQALHLSFVREEGKECRS